MNYEENDITWKALSDPTRREILDLLREKPRNTGHLSDHFVGLSRFAVMKHLNVLFEANLIFIKREGRKRWNYLNVTPIRQIYERWVKPYEEVWAGNLLNLKKHVEQHD